ncbi:MAG: glutamate 5-kinase [bacterium]|nr:glutamate 5-kinase [bacterium]
MKKKKLFVLKVGSKLLTKDNGCFNSEYLVSMADTINSNVLKKGHRIIIVSSGAVAAGLGILNLRGRPKTIPEKQALAALGQVKLMNNYADIFNVHKQKVAQILLTKSHIEDRKRYLNIRNTLLTLLNKGIIPIVNENDTVSVDEIQFGDNDTLAATVAAKMGADQLVILTDVDGVYTANPRQDKNAKFLQEIKINDKTKMEIDFSLKTGSTHGTGGMHTKFKAAKIACSSGVEVFITNGSKGLGNLFITFQKGTRFIPDEDVLSHKERWMAFGAKVKGEIVVDDGACNALLNMGKSLLPAGVLKVSGRFEEGDIVAIVNLKQHCFAKGVVEYSKLDLDKYKGKQTAEIVNSRVVIHRDNMVIIK